MKINTQKIILLPNNRIFRNICFWCLFAYFHLTTQGGVIGFFCDFLISLIFYAIPVYINNLLLIPAFLLRRRYLGYIILFLCVFSFCTYESYHVSHWAARNLPWVNYSNPFGKGILYHMFHIVLLFTFFAIGKLLTDSINNQRNLELLHKTQLETELESLKAQVNPHFLFNALNTIYGMARKFDKDTADAVMTLSDILRHNIYQSGETWISISDEVSFLQKFINFYRLRLYYKNNIRFCIEGSIVGQQIKPLLLIPFVENAIKHGLDNHYSDSWVKIVLKLTNDNLEFHCSNSVNGANKKEGAPDSGFGLQNVKRRLDLCYPGKYELKIDSNKWEYNVNLKLLLT